MLDDHAQGPPLWSGASFSALGVALFVLLEVWGIFVILSGRWIEKRRNRTGSIIIAALCMHSVPFGTALGVFALIALMNDEVRTEYECNAVMPV